MANKAMKIVAAVRPASRATSRGNTTSPANPHRIGKRCNVNSDQPTVRSSAQLTRFKGMLFAPRPCVVSNAKGDLSKTKLRECHSSSSRIWPGRP